MSQSILSTFDSKDKSLLPIIGVVILLHLLLIGWTAWMSPFSKPLPPPTPRRLVVQTVSLSPAAPPAASTVIREIAASDAPPELVLDNPKASVEKVSPKPPVEKVSPKPPLEQPAPPVKTLPPIEEVKSKPPIPTPTPTPKQPTTPPPAAIKPKDTKLPPKTEAKKPAPEKKTDAKKLPPKPTKPPPPPVKKTPPPKPAVPKPTPPPPSVKNPPPVKDTSKAEQLAAEKLKMEKAEKEAAQKAAAEEQRKIEAEKQAAQKARQQQLISQAQERMAQVGQTRDKMQTSKLPALQTAPIPSAITSLQIDGINGSNATPLTDREIGYRDELASRLKLLLKLPEYGTVKIRLTLERSGKVAKVVVVSAESNTNRNHIEKTLPSLTFPAFGTNFGREPQYTFTVTLSNEL